MSGTGKIIVALLLANLALAGALRHFRMEKPVLSAAEIRPEISPPDATNRLPSANPVSPGNAPASLDDLRRWAGRDPAAATAWASCRPAEERDEALSTVCFEMAQNDPFQAVMLADQNHLTNHATLPNLVQQWAQRDLAAARDWAASKPDGELKNELLERIACAWSSSDPVSAAQFALQHIAPGQTQTETVMAIVHQWASHNWDDANAWVQQFPEGPVRDRALHELEGIRQYQVSPVQ